MDWDDLTPKPTKGITVGESCKTLSVSRARGAHRRLAGRDRAGAGGDRRQEGARGGGRGGVQAVSIEIRGQTHPLARSKAVCCVPRV